MKKSCPQCMEELKKLQKECGECGFQIKFETDEEAMSRYLNRPSLGALLWTQVWALGARTYFWFLLSLIPFVGFIALFVLMIRGRHLSWKNGSWNSFEEFKDRMKLMDIIAGAYFTILIGTILYFQYLG